MVDFVCKAVLFDMDGVLVDSTIAIQHHWQVWADRHGLDVRKVMAVAHGRRTLETIGMIAPHLDAVYETDQIEAAEAADPEGVVVIEGARQLLQALPYQRWAIATSGTRGVAENRIRLTGLPMPQVLVTANDVRCGKPHPEPYLLAASQLAVEPRHCIVVEDAPAGIQAARSAGMRVIAVASTHARAELGQATLITGQLKDLQVVAGAQAVPDELLIRVAQT